MWKKKFKVRVRHYYKDKYVVEYAYYCIIPSWRALLFWFEASLTGNVECWSKRLMSYQDAEELATSIKSIDDVWKWYEKEEAKEQDFYRRKQEYFSNNVPYGTKYFNP